MTPIKFNGTAYLPTNIDMTPKQVREADDAGVVIIARLTTKSLLELYNLVASNLGQRAVNKFADIKTGQRRTWALLETYRAVTTAEAELETLVEAGASAHDTTEERAAKLNAVSLPAEDKAAIAEEAASRKAGSRPKSAGDALAEAMIETEAKRVTKKRQDDAAIKMPKGKKKAQRQKDGSYAFDIKPGKPRTETVSTQREELIGHLVEGEATWQSIKDLFGKDDFCTVTTVTMFCITLGYGVLTQPDGTIKLLEPLA